MRARNHLAIKAECRGHIPTLMAHFGWPGPEQIEMDTEGWVNPCFFVDDRYVFRFNARDPSLPKFQRERLAFATLRGSGLPVPEVLALEVSRRVSPYDVLVTGRLPGDNIEAAWPHLAPLRRTRLAKEAGRALARIHATTLPRFGELARPADEDDDLSWTDCVAKMLKVDLEDADALGIFDDDTCQRFRRLVEALRVPLAQVRRPALVHGDYHFGNLLHVDDALTGVLDFEWCLGGDPALDLALMTSMETWPGAEAPFFDGYAEAGGPARSDDPLVPFYRCLRNVTLCVVAKRHLSSREDAEYRRVALGRLASLERQLSL